MSEDNTLRVELAGELGETSSVVESGTITMAFATGRVNDDPLVLVPMLSCQLTGRFGRHDTPANPCVTMTFDNVAHLLMQFSSEYSEAIDVLSGVVPARLGATPARLKQVADWLLHGSTYLQKAAEKLTALSEHLEAERSSAGAVRKATEEPASTPVRLRRRIVTKSSATKK